MLAILLGKFLLAFLLPFIGVAIALFFGVAKLVLMAGLVFIAVWLLRRSNREEEKLS